MAFGIFKFKRQKILIRYEHLFKVVPIYGAVYGFYLRNDDGDRAVKFKGNYAVWRELAPLLVDEGTTRDELEIMVDELFDSAKNNPDLIPTLTMAKADNEEKILITNTQKLKEVLKDHGKRG